MGVRLRLAWLVLGIGWSSVAWGSDPAAHVGVKLDGMHAWLGEDANGQRWRRLLMSEELQQQLARRSDADRFVVHRALSRYEGDTPGLDRPRFQAVRSALRDWIETLPPVDGSRLIEAVAEAGTEFSPRDSAEVERARSRLQRAMRDLEQYLSRGTPENLQRWKRYLRWDQLEAGVASETPDVLALQLVRDQFFRNIPGLEDRRFLRVREALWDYMNAYFYAHAEQAADQHPQVMDALARSLENYEQAPNLEDAQVIGMAVDWLERSRQHPELVQAVRHRYWRPNLYAQVSERLAVAGFRDDVRQVTPVDEMILGTRVRGTAVMTGDVSLRFVPSDRGARFNIHLRGLAESDNVGFNRSVRIFTTGLSRIRAAKQVVFTANGLNAGESVASVVTNTTIRNIAAPLHIVRHIAWKRAQQSRPAAERIASRSAERRTRRQMDRQAADLLADANLRYQERFREPLIRLGAFPQRLDFRTTEHNLLIELTEVTPSQISSSEPPPAIELPFDLAAQIHESLAGNLSEAMLAGVTLTDEEVAQLAEDLTGEVPPALEIRPENDPWSITFAAAQPVSSTFRDGGMRIAIRGRRFTRNDQVIRDRIEISATYLLEKTDTGSRLVRDGDVRVDYLDRPTLGVPQVAFRRFLTNRFRAVFQEEIEFEGFQLPGRFEQAGTLRARTLHSENGWLALTFELDPHGRPPVASTDNVRPESSVGAQ